MLEMAGLDNPNGSPFMVGEKQREWLQKDLAKVTKDTPVVVFSHSPMQKIYKGWNFWTDDAEQVQALLAPFDKVNVVYGHVHQIQYNQIGNISFNSVMATAWPWPYPQTYAQAESHPAEAHRADEPRRSVLRARRDGLADHQRQHGTRRRSRTTCTTTSSRTVAFDPKLRASGRQELPGPEALRAEPEPITEPRRQHMTERNHCDLALGRGRRALAVARAATARADEFTAAGRSSAGRRSSCRSWPKGRAAVDRAAKLGTNGVACAQCHPNAANTHPETYPKFQKQIGKVMHAARDDQLVHPQPARGAAARARRSEDDRDGGVRHL